MVKRGVRGIVIATAAVLPLLLTGAAAADATNNCSIYNTGTDSYNACVASNSNQTYVTCTNNVYTVYTNSQSSSSGNANNNNNSTSGNTTSGSAVNSNGTTVTIGASCGTPATTTTPGTGGGTTTTTTPAPTTMTPAPTATKQAAKPAATVLPETGSNILTESAIIGFTAVAGVLALSKVGLTLLQRVTVK